MHSALPHNAIFVGVTVVTIILTQLIGDFHLQVSLAIFVGAFLFLFEFWLLLSFIFIQ